MLKEKKTNLETSTNLLFKEIINTPLRFSCNIGTTEEARKILGPATSTKEAVTLVVATERKYEKELTEKGWDSFLYLSCCKISDQEYIKNTAESIDHFYNNPM